MKTTKPNMTKDYIITLTPRDFKPKGSKYPTDAPYTSSGQLYDLLAIAAGHQEINDIESDNLEVYDGAIDYVVKNYDWEVAYIEHLNQATSGVLHYNHTTINDDNEHNTKWKDSGLLFGAYIALNYPEDFTASMKEWRENVEEVINDCLGGYEGREGLPADLAQELDEAYGSVGDDMMREYLHGDYRGDWAGVYKEAHKALFRNYDSIDLDQSDEDRRQNIITVKIDEDEGRELVADWEGCDLTKARIGSERVKAAIVGTILHAAERHVNERKARAEKRRAEREQEEAYRKERQAKEEAERRAKLLAMTK